MANPQKENGYTPIANELLEALCKIRISGEARQVYDVILRKTYGFNKLEDMISISQFVLYTTLRDSAVCKAVAKLVRMNVITKKGNIYGIIKDFETWRPLPKKETLPKKEINTTQKGNKSLPKKRDTKDNINTKDNTAKKAPIKKKTFRNKERYLDQTPYSLEDFVKAMRSSTLRHMKIIAEYADEIKPDKYTKGQWHEFIDRNVRAAQRVATYDDKQIERAMTKIEANRKTPKNPRGYITKWTLETLLTYID